MLQIQQVTREPRNLDSGPVYSGNEHGDLPVDDPPPADHPSERYSAWSATSIFTFVPFSSPSGR
jgi:hypothetical protein